MFNFPSAGVDEGRTKLLIGSCEREYIRCKAHTLCQAVGGNTNEDLVLICAILIHFDRKCEEKS